MKKRFFVLLVLVLIGGFSYFSYVVVQNEREKDLDNEIAGLKSQVEDKNKEIQKLKETYQGEKKNIKDALTIILPQQSSLIESAFSDPAITLPSTQPVEPTTQETPTTQP